MNNETNPHKVKQRQMVTLIILGAVVLLGGFGLYELMTDDSKTPSPGTTATTHFVSPLEHMDTEKVWNERVENKVAEAMKKSEEAKREAAKATQSVQSNASEQVIQQLTQQLTALQQEVTELKTSNAASEAHPNNVLTGMREDSLQLMRTERTDTTFKNPANYVPSGTFVKAIMIGGADAPAAVTSQSNPKPMVFHIVERGTLPNHRKSHLKDCTVTAAVAGDISSERGEIRLETLSCVKPTGEILDIPVQGTAFGRDGKSGVRGTAVWREGALIQRAAGAGVLSGFSDALSQRYTTTSISPLGSTQSVNGGSMMQYGAAKGASNAMNKLAEYYIQRAEQYHPVIQLSAGDTVDIVFLKGFYLEDKTSDATRIPPSTPVSQTTSSAPVSPLPLTPKQIERLKAHQKALSLNTPPEVHS